MPPEAPSTGKDTRLNGVQYLRALAAVSVVLFHLSEFAGHPIPTFAAFGVPLFFVISGFIMVAITDDGTNAAGFLARRILRVGPMYWLMTLVMIAVWPWAFRGYRDLAASLAFLPYHFERATHSFMPPLAVGWTLNLEMMFYVLFTMTILAVEARFRPLLLSAVLVLLVIIGKSGLPIPARAAFFCQPVILLFGIGSLMGYCWRCGRVPVSLVLGAVVAIAALIGWMVSPSQYAWAASLFMVVLATMAGTLVLERRGAFRIPIAPLSLLGDASYSIYLVHPIVIFATLRILDAEKFGPAAVVAVFLMSIAAGVGLFLVVERPILRWSRAMLKIRLPILAQAW